MRFLMVTILLLALGGCEFIGGADTLVRGSNNFVALDGRLEGIARSLSEFESTPAVTDEELESIYARIRAEALGGNMDAVNVMLRLAAIQREPASEGDEDG